MTEDIEVEVYEDDIQGDYNEAQIMKENSLSVGTIRAYNSKLINKLKEYVRSLA